nr:unnamed protein product [Digitaria exilis]
MAWQQHAAECRGWCCVAQIAQVHVFNNDHTPPLPRRRRELVGQIGSMVLQLYSADADADQMRLTGPHPAKFPGRLPPSHSRGVRHPATGGGIYESSVAPPSLGRGGMLPRHHRRPAHSEPAFITTRQSVAQAPGPWPTLRPRDGVPATSSDLDAVAPFMAAYGGGCGRIYYSVLPGTPCQDGHGFHGWPGHWVAGSRPSGWLAGRRAPSPADGGVMAPGRSAPTGPDLTSASVMALVVRAIADGLARSRPSRDKPALTLEPSSSLHSLTHTWVNSSPLLAWLANSDGVAVY